MSGAASTFVHLSDTHFFPAGATTPHGLDPAANLRQVAEWGAAEGLAPASFLISGDLSNDGDPESYRHFATALHALEARFGVPILRGLGNHDRRGPFRRLVLGEPVGDDDQTPYYYSRQIGGLRVLMLDSLLPGEIDGELGAAQLAWLAEELRAPTPGGDLVVLHHPVTPRGIPRAGIPPARCRRPPRADGAAAPPRDPRRAHPRQHGGAGGRDAGDHRAERRLPVRPDRARWAAPDRGGGLQPLHRPRRPTPRQPDHPAGRRGGIGTPELSPTEYEAVASGRQRAKPGRAWAHPFELKPHRRSQLRGQPAVVRGSRAAHLTRCRNPRPRRVNRARFVLRIGPGQPYRLRRGGQQRGHAQRQPPEERRRVLRDEPVAEAEAGQGVGEQPRPDQQQAAPGHATQPPMIDSAERRACRARTGR